MKSEFNDPYYIFKKSCFSSTAAEKNYRRLEILTSVVWTFDTFENNWNYLQIHEIFEGELLVGFNQHFCFKHFFGNSFG